MVAFFGPRQVKEAAVALLDLGPGLCTTGTLDRLPLYLFDARVRLPGPLHSDIRLLITPSGVRVRIRSRAGREREYVMGGPAEGG